MTSLNSESSQNSTGSWKLSKEGYNYLPSTTSPPSPRNAGIKALETNPSSSSPCKTHQILPLFLISPLRLSTIVCTQQADSLDTTSSY